MTKPIIAQETLKAFVHYNPKTGIFTAIKKRPHVEIGDILGDIENGYLRFCLNGTRKKAHRFAFLYMTGKIPVEVDHINGVRTDNRWENLKPTTSQGNSRNSARVSNNTSGITGVSWDKVNQKWCAHINVDYKMIRLGRFKTKLAAAYCRHQANLKYGFTNRHGA